MSRRSLSLSLISSAAVMIATLYNACGKIGDSNAVVGASCANATLKSARLENTLLTPAKTQADVPNVFAAGKVQLGQTTTSTAKTAGKTVRAAGLDPAFAAGTSLAVIVDATCLRTNRDAIMADAAGALISRAALDSGTLRDDLERQAFAWTLPGDFTASQISTAAEAEACVVGVSFNHEFTAGGVTLNDPVRAQQTYIAADNADAAYQVVFAPGTGLSTTGPAVVVAVIDSGLDVTHADIAGHVWAGPNGHGFNVTNGTADVHDVSDEGHGTHVSGMIAAVSNNGVGISGLMPYRALIMPIQVWAVDAQGNATSSTTTIYNGIRVAVANGADVINISMQTKVQGVAQSDPAMQQALIDAVSAGVPVMVAMGNGQAATNYVGQLIDNVKFSSLPAIYANLPGVIGVGSINATGGGWSAGSNYGTAFTEIAAPGYETDDSGVLSLFPTALGSYGFLGGTSQATPQVTAAAAMTIAILKSAYGRKPSAAEVERLITASASKQSGLVNYVQNGNRLDLLRLVAYIKSQYPLALTGVVVPGC